MNIKIVRSQLGQDKIKCECGAEIPILRDVRATSDAIEVHVALHVDGVKGPSCTKKEAESLRNALITQVFRITSEPEEE